MTSNTVKIRDNRTGREYDLEIQEGTIRAGELRQIKTDPDDFGLITYDPGFTATASCKSTITFIDGEKGILRHRGYPIEELAGQVEFLRVAYLVFHGELPSEPEFSQWRSAIAGESDIPEGLLRIISGFPRDATGMAMLASCIAALSGFHPDAADLDDADRRRAHLIRLIAQIPTVAAAIARHKARQTFVPPEPDLDFSENFLRMVFSEDEAYQPNPVYRRALDVLFVLHADHEQNCSANAMRSVGSSRPDPYLAAAAAVAALAGPLHGGANAAVLRMLSKIGSLSAIPGYIEQVKAGQFRLMGFGHRVYKNYDPRARIIKAMADEVLAVSETTPLLEVAAELERIALQDDYFVSRKLYPNVDFYSGLIYQAIGFPTWMFPVLFAVGRMCGWVSQWEELIQDSEQRIARPRQIYLGHELRHLES